MKRKNIEDFIVSIRAIGFSLCMAFFVVCIVPVFSLLAVNFFFSVVFGNDVRDSSRLDEESQSVRLIQYIETEPGMMCARNQKEFEKCEFLRHQVTGLKYSWPEINFDKYIVVFVFGAPRHDATPENYSVRVTSVNVNILPNEDGKKERCGPKEVVVSARSSFEPNEHAVKDSTMFYAPCAIHYLDRKTYGIHDNTTTFFLQMQDLVDSQPVKAGDVTQLPHAPTIKELFKK